MNGLLNKKKESSLWKELRLPVISFLAVVALVGYGIHNLGSVAKEEQLRFAKEAVDRAVVQCYAIEGRYPPDIAYLEENYGLSVDTDRYVIHYQQIAANLLPDIEVFAKDN